MRGIPHRWQAWPVVRPAVHILHVAASQKLQAAQHTFVVKIFHIKVFAAIDDGFHHHIGLAAGSLGLDNRAALFHGCPHGHGTGHMLAGFEGGDAHPSVIRDGAVDVNGVDVGIVQNLLVFCVSNRNIVLVASLVQSLGIAPADGVHLSAGIILINRNELCAEAKANNGHSERFLCGHTRKSPG